VSVIHTFLYRTKEQPGAGLLFGVRLKTSQKCHIPFTTVLHCFAILVTETAYALHHKEIDDVTN